MIKTQFYDIILNDIFSGIELFLKDLKINVIDKDNIVIINFTEDEIDENCIKFDTLMKTVYFDKTYNLKSIHYNINEIIKKDSIQNDGIKNILINNLMSIPIFAYISALIDSYISYRNDDNIKKVFQVLSKYIIDSDNRKNFIKMIDKSYTAI